MKELDYHPNSLARSLVNGSTFTIGLVIDAGNSDAFSNAIFIRSVSAIEGVTQQRGFNLLITSDSDKENNTAKQEPGFREKDRWYYTSCFCGNGGTDRDSALQSFSVYCVRRTG